MPKINPYKPAQVKSKVKALRKAFAEARYEHGITHAMIEEAAGLPATTLSHMLAGRRALTVMERYDIVLQAIKKLSVGDESAVA